MRILFLTQVLPYPLDAGPKIRAYYVLKHLARRGHEITLASFVRPEDNEEGLSELNAVCREVHTVPIRRSLSRDLQSWIKSLVTGEPFLISRDRDPEMVRLVHKLLNRESGFDAVHSDQLWMASYARLARRMDPRPKLVLDQHNAVFQIPKRLSEGEGNPVKKLLLSQEAKKLVSYETRCCADFDQVVWVTQEDWKALEEANLNGFKAQAPKVIPICLEPVADPPTWKPERANRVTFVGGMHWPPNAQGVEWFVRDVWPRVRERVGESRLTIIGKFPPKSIRSAAGLGDSIEILGYVPSLADYLSQTAVFIVPLHSGGGMRVKILEAWRWGLPVVSTTIGAEGLEVSSGENLILADSSEGFAVAVSEVLTCAELANRLSKNGRATLAKSYDWQKAYPAWDEVYP